MLSWSTDKPLKDGYHERELGRIALHSMLNSIILRFSWHLNKGCMHCIHSVHGAWLNAATSEASQIVSLHSAQAIVTIIFISM